MGEDTANKKRENRDFVQFYRGYMDELPKLARSNATAFDLFILLTKHMDGTNALCVSNVALSELMGITTRTVQRAVKYLKDNGWIDVLKSGTANVYIVNPDVAWTSYDNQKKYCKFNSTVLLSSSENAEYLKNKSKAFTHFKTVDTDFIKDMAAKHEEFTKRVENLKSVSREQATAPSVPGGDVPDWVRKADEEIEAEFREIEEGVVANG